MSPQDRRLATGDLVLVTGANGYIATHIVDVLLEQGYNVRGTLRSEKPWLNKYFEEKYGNGRFETRIVKALNQDGAFDEVVKGVGGIVHVVSLAVAGMEFSWPVLSNGIGCRRIVEPRSRCGDYMGGGRDNQFAEGCF